jgi:hypothetical protein
VKPFAEWLSQTSLSLAIQSHEWIVPTIQSIHIVAIGVTFASVFMIVVRVLGWSGRDQTLAQTDARFGPWLMWGLAVLLATGVGMVIGEPPRELLALSFWLKMALIVVGTATAVVFRRSLRRDRAPMKATAVATLLIWMCIVVLGRLIAYDYVWGSWSAALKG